MTATIASQFVLLKYNVGGERNTGQRELENILLGCMMQAKIRGEWRTKTFE